MLDILPDYLHGTHFIRSVWPNLLFPLLLSAGVAWLITLRKRYRPLRGTYLFALLAFSLLGIVIGNITGLSRNPAVAVTIPAILTLVGGVLAFVVGSQGIGRQRLVSAGLICLSICLLVGIMWGSRSRVLFEYQAKALEEARTQASLTAPEDASFRSALISLQNEVKFLQLKAGLEAKHNVKLTTTYPPPVERDAEERSAPAETPAPPDPAPEQ